MNKTSRLFKNMKLKIGWEGKDKNKIKKKDHHSHPSAIKKNLRKKRAMEEETVPILLREEG